MSRLRLFAVFALGLVAPIFAQGDPLAAVREAELARFEAQTRRDTTALRLMLGDDLTYIHSNALVETKDHFIETIALGRIVYDSIVPLEMRYRLLGGAAVGQGKVRVQVRMGGQTARVDLLVTTVHALRDDRWQLVAWQSTRDQ